MIEVQIQITESKKSMEIDFNILKREDVSEREIQFAKLLEEIYKGIVKRIADSYKCDVESTEIK